MRKFRSLALAVLALPACTSKPSVRPQSIGARPGSVAPPLVAGAASPVQTADLTPAQTAIQSRIAGHLAFWRAATIPGAIPDAHRIQSLLAAADLRDLTDVNTIQVMNDGDLTHGPTGLVWLDGTRLRLGPWVVLFGFPNFAKTNH